MFYSVDAIEGGVARLIDDTQTALWTPLSALPSGVRETEVLEWQGGVWRRAPEEAGKRRAEAAALLQRLLHKNG